MRRPLPTKLPTKEKCALQVLQYKYRFAYSTNTESTILFHLIQILFLKNVINFWISICQFIRLSCTQYCLHFFINMCLNIKMFHTSVDYKQIKKTIKTVSLLKKIDYSFILLRFLIIILNISKTTKQQTVLCAAIKWFTIQCKKYIAVTILNIRVQWHSYLKN